MTSATHKIHRALLLVLAGTTGACGHGESADHSHSNTAPRISDTAPSLIDHEAWTVAADSADPFPEHRPPEVTCPEWSYGLEGEVFEVETDDCNYLSLTQPSLVDLKAGDHVKATLWHLELWAPNPATAHIAVQIGEDVVWEESIPVPGSEKMYEPVWIVPEDRPAGTPIHFHLHNHGTNSWRFLSLSAAAAP